MRDYRPIKRSNYRSGRRLCESNKTKEYGIPIHYTMYGMVWVTAGSKKQAYQEAEKALDEMDFDDIEALCDVLVDSVGIDYEGTVIDSEGTDIDMYF